GGGAAERADRWQAAAGGERDPVRGADRRGAGARPRAARDPPGSKERERDGDEGRAGQGAGLWAGEAGVGGGRERADAITGDSDRDRRGGGDAALLGAGGATRGEGGCGERRVGA